MDRKTGEALHLLIQFHNFVGQPGDLVTKAQVYDEIMAKAFLMTRAKVINIVVDYSSKMETLLAKMQKLMVGLYLTAYRSTKTQVNPSSALNRTKHHQSNPSNVPGILDSNLSKRACVYTSKSLTT